MELPPYSAEDQKYPLEPRWLGEPEEIIIPEKGVERLYCKLVVAVAFTFVGSPQAVLPLYALHNASKSAVAVGSDQPFGQISCEALPVP